MFILEVAPLLFIPRPQNQLWTYFSREKTARGGLVEVGFKNKKVKGIVMACAPLSALKIKLRKEKDFSLRPVRQILSVGPVLPPILLKTALWLSAQYFSPLGACLKIVLPPFFGAKKYPFITFSDPDKFPLNNAIFVPELAPEFIPTKNLQKHYQDYLTIIDRFRTKQLLFIVPEKTYLNYFSHYYKDFNPILVHGGIKNADLYKTYKKVAAGESCLVIGTRRATFLPFSNLGAIILDNESNDLSRPDAAPRYETPELIRFLSREYQCPLFVNDQLPSIKTYTKLKPTEKRLINLKTITGQLEIVDLAAERQNGNFSILGHILQEKVIKDAKENEKTILFVSRRGYANALFCRFCFKTITCPNCQISLPLHQLANQAYQLKCHHCQLSMEAPSLCPRCQKTLLEQKGFGIQKVIRELTTLFKHQGSLPAPPLFELSQETALAPADFEKVINQFQQSTNGILVATQKLLSWRYLIKAKTVGILNADWLFNFPDFRAWEEGVQTLMALFALGSEIFLQSYDPTAWPWPEFLKNQWSKLWDNEWRQRKRFSLPPVSELIKLRIGQGRASFAEQEARLLSVKLQRQAALMNLSNSDLELLPPLPGFISRQKNLFVWQIIIKNKRLKTSQRNELLRFVPSRWKIEINPKES